MAKTDPQKEKQARLQRTNAYAEKVRQIFAASVNQILELKKKVPDLDKGIMYSFDGDTEKVQAEVEAIFRRMHSLATAAIKQGIKLEWNQANSECDALVKSCFGKKVMDTPMFRAYTQRNTAAMDAFINRSERGMNLSDRVWKSVRQQREELEAALTVSMGEGSSAQDISRRVRQYLNDPDLMFRRLRYKVKETEVKDDEGNVIGKKIEWSRKWKKAYRDEEGRLRFKDYDKDDYKVGRGVYKSAARNAMRLARTETNMAYRNAEHERWQRMDFVVGQRVQLSAKHPVYDICDELAGDYPKDFRFEGWHPQCFCYVTPIMVDEDEMERMTEAAMRGEEYKPKGEAVRDYPEAYKRWCRDNAETIERRWSEGKQNPYFIEHNREVYQKILDGYDFEKDMVSTGNGGNKPPKDNATALGGDGDDGGDDGERRRRIEEHRREYEQYKNNSDYIDVLFDEETGGLKGRHKSHVETPAIHAKERKYFSTETFEGYTGKDLELLCQNVLYKRGYSCILVDEKVIDSSKQLLSILDSLTNGKPMDIKSITETGPNTIHNALNNKVKQIRKFNNHSSIKADSVIMYFHTSTLFDSFKVKEALVAEQKAGSSIKEVICVIGDKDRIEVIK
ncbi:MAG: hypothetical protein LIO90_11335 [Bacteroidales bacterium]|nr:hypothetical protein [Bacteroidales bacterium]